MRATGSRLISQFSPELLIRTAPHTEELDKQQSAFDSNERDRHWPLTCWDSARSQRALWTLVMFEPDP
jgi:hypothetical protein